MIKDTLVKRVAKVAIDAIKHTTQEEIDNSLRRNITIEINIASTRPIVSIPQTLHGVTTEGTDPADISYESALATRLTTVPTLSDFKNSLFDIDDRFTPISIIETVGDKRVFYLYHDNKYKDLLLLPSLRFIGDTTNNVNALSDTTIKVDGFRIGVPVTPVALTSKADIQLHDLPQPLELRSSRTSILPLHSHFSDSNFGTLSVGNVRSEKLRTMTGVSLGTSTGLFEDMIISKVIQSLTGIGTLKNTTRKIEVNDILILLP